MERVESSQPEDDRRIEVSGVVYGIGIHGNLPTAFRRYLLPRDAEADEADDDLEVTYRTVDSVPETKEIWESEPGGPDTPGRLTLSRLPRGFGLTVCGEERGSLRCTAKTLEIQWSSRAISAVAHHLFAYALPLWLETRGVPVLHGSAVALGDRAVGFIGPSGVGKSVLCAELLNLGCGFVTDDGIALQRGTEGTWRCPQGPPWLRLWPSGLAGRLDVAPESLPRVVEIGDKRRLHLTPDRRPPLPLAAIYVLRRRSGREEPIQVSPFTPRKSLIRLLEHGVAAAPAAALGLGGKRFEHLADAAEKIAVQQLEYPSGVDSAARILEAIEGDLEEAQ